MKEITIKFESEGDYERFIQTICTPSSTLLDGRPDCEWDQENNILTVNSNENDTQF